jgi:hypothetical protein
VLGRFGDGGHEIGLSNVLVKVDATVGKLAEGSLLLELCVREVWSARFCPLSDVLCRPSNSLISRNLDRPWNYFEAKLRNKLIVTYQQPLRHSNRVESCQ